MKGLKFPKGLCQQNDEVISPSSFGIEITRRFQMWWPFFLAWCSRNSRNHPNDSTAGRSRDTAEDKWYLLIRHISS